MSTPTRLSILINAFLLLFVATVFTFGFEASYTYTVTGRVVDENGKPVRDVDVSLRSPHYDEGDIVYGNWTDGSGKFTIQKKSERRIRDWKLYVSESSTLPKDTNELLDLHAGTAFCSEFYKTLCGKSVHPAENKYLDLGDVRLTVRQYPVLVRLRNQAGDPVIFEGSGFTPWWRVRDPLGDIIGEGGSSRAANRVADSAVMIALPSGKWKVEISDDGGSGVSGSVEIDVKPSIGIREIDVKLNKVEERYSFNGVTPYPTDGRRRAKELIRKRGFNFSKASFERRVVLGNHELVELYLRAGMNPNVFTTNRETLMMSLSRPVVLKLLLEGGADVNRPIDRGITPLLQAVGWLVIPKATIQMLLDAGADLNAKADDGRNAFTLAEDRHGVTELLEKYRSKKTKD